MYLSIHHIYDRLLLSFRAAHVIPDTTVDDGQYVPKMASKLSLLTSK